MKRLNRMCPVLAGFVLASCSMFCAAEETEIYTHECTSWMVFQDLTKNGTHLLHKNRDSKYGNIKPLVSGKKSPRKWIGLGNGSALDHDAEFVCMGMNASGLAAVVNSGELAVEHSLPGAKMGTPEILKECLEHCDTAAQAVQKMDEIRKSGQYSHGKKGSIFLFMDLKEAYIAEITSGRCSVARYDHGYAFRANIWHNPDMAAVSNNTTAGWINSCNREFMVIRDLNNAFRKNGKITVFDSLETSRDTVTPKGSPEPRTLCSKSTNSASTLEIHLKYPDVLSTGYFLIGPPRHTICIPVPICVETYLPCMKDLSWSSAARKSFEKNGFGAELPPAWKEQESRSLKLYKDAQEKAEKLLAEGKRKEAVKLLNDSASAIWKDAAKLILPEGNK